LNRQVYNSKINPRGVGGGSWWKVISKKMIYLITY
jgi:hypothetical protein